MTTFNAENGAVDALKEAENEANAVAWEAAKAKVAAEVANAVLEVAILEKAGTAAALEAANMANVAKDLAAARANMAKVAVKAAVLKVAEAERARE